MVTTAMIFSFTVNDFHSRPTLLLEWSAFLGFPIGKISGNVKANGRRVFRQENQPMIE